jgi:hypothetical protein
LPADGVNRVVGQSRDVEVVEDQYCLRAASSTAFT